MDRHTDPQRIAPPAHADLSGMAPVADTDFASVEAFARNCACNRPDRTDRTHGKGICFKRDAVTDAAVTAIDYHNGSCTCGDPDSPNVEHSYDSPCHHVDRLDG